MNKPSLLVPHLSKVLLSGRRLRKKRRICAIGQEHTQPNEHKKKDSKKERKKQIKKERQTERKKQRKT
jgi:hypothetical protein